MPFTKNTSRRPCPQTASTRRLPAVRTANKSTYETIADQLDAAKGLLTKKTKDLDSTRLEVARLVEETTSLKDAMRKQRRQALDTEHALERQLEALTTTAVGSSESDGDEAEIQIRNRKRSGPRDDEDMSARTRLAPLYKSDMEEFMDERFEGGSGGKVALLAVVAYVAAHLEVLEYIVEEHDIRRKAALTVITRLKQHWTTDTCCALFVHGKLDMEGYQAIINNLCKWYCPVLERWLPLHLGFNVYAPKLAARDAMKDKLTEAAGSYGMASICEGQGAVASPEIVLRERVEDILEECPPAERPTKCQWLRGWIQPTGGSAPPTRSCATTLPWC